MNKRILSLALPNIISNITVPLLGMVDLAIVGRLGGTASIGAIAIGTAIFNLVYWNFGFLRMGTSGMTAQAYGRRSFQDMMNMLSRSIIIALIISVFLVILQKPLYLLTTYFMGGSENLNEMVAKYFYVRIWGAPATLGMYVFKGWFIGMQNSKTPMIISIMINVINIVLSYTFAFPLGMGIAGVALGTILAQYFGCVVSMIIISRHYGKILRYYSFTESIRLSDMKHFFKINSDIFVRTIFLSLVFASFTAFSTKMGDSLLAINTVLLQLFTLFSYFMDGFAYAGESLAGRYYGAKSKVLLNEAVKSLLWWGIILSAIVTVIYTFFLTPLVSIFTNVQDVILGIQDYKWWVVAIPFTGFLAFIFDGVLIGMTKTKIMRNTIVIASLFFYGAYYLLIDKMGNDAIWLALILFLFFRGIIQYIGYRKIKF